MATHDEKIKFVKIFVFIKYIYETLGTFLYWLADEKGSNAEPNIVSIRREIRVEDRNDNVPLFSDPIYNVVVNETASVNSVIFSKILVSDADSGENAEVKLSCLKEVKQVSFRLKILIPHVEILWSFPC